MHLSRGKTEEVLASTPSEHWFLGFKDRDLEEEYLNDLVVASKNRLYLGYGMIIFFLVAMDLVPEVLAITLGKDPKEDEVITIGLYVAAFLVFLAGLIFR